MLLVVAVTSGSLFYFSTLVVQRQINRLPPDLRDQFRDRAEPGTGPSDVASAAGSSPSPGGPHGPSAPNGPAKTLLPGVIGPLLPGDWRTPSSSQRRANGFLRSVGESLQGATVVSAVFGLIVALLLARRVARPISAVSEAAARVAAGDLSVRAEVLPGDRETTELARSFNAMAQGLEQLEQERRDTVASIAHELRTPLTVMQARLDAIEDGIYPLDQAQVGQLSAQTQLLTRLVADLRTLSLAEAGRLTLQHAQVEALRLVQEVAQDIQAARAGGIRVEVHGQAATLRADPDRLRQVLVNLTENAFKHARSRVQLTVQGGQGALRLHIDDDGPGIPEPQREHVFERFVRLEGSRSRDTGGSGLGLAVVRALMLAHGGEVVLGVSPLGGTRATLSFPLEGAGN